MSAKQSILRSIFRTILKSHPNREQDGDAPAESPERNTGSLSGAERTVSGDSSDDTLIVRTRGGRFKIRGDGFTLANWHESSQSLINPTEGPDPPRSLCFTGKTRLIPLQQ